MTLHQEQEVAPHERSRSLTTARSPLDDQAVAAGNLGEEAKEARRAHHITTALCKLQVTRLTIQGSHGLNKCKVLADS